MIKRFAFILLNVVFYTSTPGVHAQNEAPVRYDILLRTKMVDVDNMGRLYVVTPENSVIHYDANKAEKFRYTNRRSGEITHINLSNPLKILLYAKDFGQVIILDNTLAEVDIFNLFDVGFTEISAVGVSNDDSFWLYDPLRFRLLKISRAGKIIHESANLMDFGIQKPYATKIIESGNHVVLHDPKNGFFVFDNFGQFIRFLPIEHVKTFGFDGQQILWFSGKTLNATSLNGLSTREICRLPDAETEIVRDIIRLPDTIVKVFEKGITFEPK